MAKEIQYRKLTELKKLPNNPRTIKKDDMERLKKSIKDNGEKDDDRGRTAQPQMLHDGARSKVLRCNKKALLEVCNR